MTQRSEDVPRVRLEDEDWLRRVRPITPAERSDGAALQEALAEFMDLESEPPDGWLEDVPPDKVTPP